MPISDDTPQPPPPPPIPGAPAEGFTLLEGTLRGVGPARPLAHVVVATRAQAMACAHGEGLRLELESGREVALDVADTVVFGPPFPRQRATFAELRGAHPWLSTALGERAPGGDEDAEIRGQALTEERRVYVAGVVTEHEEAAFRESAGTPKRLRAAAISLTPLSETTFPTLGTGAFLRDARPLDHAHGLPQRYGRVNRAFSGIVGIGLGGGGSLLASAWLRPTMPKPVLVLGLILFGVGFAALPLLCEFVLRTATPIVWERDRKKRPGPRPRLPAPGSAVALLIIAMIPGFALSANLAAMLHPRPNLVLLSLLTGAVTSLWQLPGWLLSCAPALLRSWGARLRGPTAEGLLAEPLTVHEAHTDHVVVTGTEQRVMPRRALPGSALFSFIEGQRQVTSVERRRSWTSRSVQVYGQPMLAASDGARTRLHPRRVIVAGLAPAPTDDPATFAVEGRFVPGDVVWTTATREARDGALVLCDVHTLTRALVVATAAALIALLVVALSTFAVWRVFAGR
jgi:hypothetical protein